MDFNRSGQPRPSAVPAASVQAAAPQKQPKEGGWKQGKLYRISFLALLMSGTVLFIAVIFFLVFGKPINHEAKYVMKDQYQAVFVNVNGTNGGQVYFGKIASLTPDFIRLTHVFYIQNQSTSTSTSNAYNLVKLGCELHGPNDEMVINRSQVFFWENLKNDGQVAQKAAEWYKQNPNGQKCNTTSNTTDQSTSTTQNSSNTGTSTGSTGTGTTSTGTSTTTTKKQ